MKHENFAQTSSTMKRIAAECAELREEVARLRHENEILNMMVSMMGAEMDIMGVAQGATESNLS